MKDARLILAFFFLLFIVFYSPAANAVIGEGKLTKSEGPVDIEADELIFERETQTYEAHGEVEIIRGDLSLKADHARMDMATKEMVAWGNVLLREGEDVIECQRLEVNLDSRLGKIYQAKLFLKEQNFHIAGQEVDKLGENHYRLREGWLTTCDAKRPPWKFSVKELDVNAMASGGRGIAKGPVFYLEDIPVLYFPWGVFPVRQERQSGFLLPRTGYSSSDGARLKTGFYWAMAKNMDATLYLDYLGNRGFKEGLEYRYAFTQDTRGQVNFNYIDDQDAHKKRYSFFVQHEQVLPYDFYIKADVNRVSDHQYLHDFWNEYLPTTSRMAAIDSNSSRQLRSVVFGGKDWDHFSLVGQTTVYDDLTQTSNDATLQKLPQINFSAHPQTLFNTPLFFSLDSSYTNFRRERASTDPAAVTSGNLGGGVQRGDLFPTLSYATRLLNVIKFQSDVGVRGTVYGGQNDPTGTVNGWRSRETFQADAQMSTEFYRVYSAEALSKLSDIYKVDKWMHTIEPTVSYTYIPQVFTRHLPNFDQVDQMPFTNQFTYGVTQRLVGKPEKMGVSSGPYEYAKLIISQSYSLGDHPFASTTGKSFSDIRAEMWWNFTPQLSAHWDADLNPSRGSLDIFDFAIVAKDLRSDAVQVQYRDTRGTDREVNVDARLKIIPSLYTFGSFYYNLLAGSWVQFLLGAEYQAQCWTVGFYIQDINGSPDGTLKRQLKYMFYLNLLGLGSSGQEPGLMRF
ncbi:MAG TPA: LPS assembly protein LptD [Thermodesulfobacteriota bacterium]|nr:LPS assembly protein LptD [Thermodesulfobacteriota bacterium]